MSSASSISGLTWHDEEPPAHPARQPRHPADLRHHADGKRLFDRLQDNSDIVLIDLPK
jgi:hypothetical protein